MEQIDFSSGEEIINKFINDNNIIYTDTMSDGNEISFIKKDNYYNYVFTDNEYTGKSTTYECSKEEFFEELKEFFN